MAKWATLRTSRTALRTPLVRSAMVASTLLSRRNRCWLGCRELCLRLGAKHILLSRREQGVLPWDSATHFSLSIRGTITSGTPPHARDRPWWFIVRDSEPISKLCAVMGDQLVKPSTGQIWLGLHRKNPFFARGERTEELLGRTAPLSRRCREAQDREQKARRGGAPQLRETRK